MAGLPANIKFGNLVAMGLLFLCWIFNFVGIGDVSWYTIDNTSFGLTSAEFCFRGTCQDFKYSDNASQLGSDGKKLRAGGALAMTFLVFNIIIIPIVGLLIFIDTIGDKLKFLLVVTAKLPKQIKDNTWLLPVAPLGLFSLALLFWIALWPYDATGGGFKHPDPGAAMILVIISIIFCIGSIFAIKFMDQLLAGNMGGGASKPKTTEAKPAEDPKPASGENPPPYPG